MTTSPDISYLNSIRRDNRLSVIIGPIKLVIPALSYLLLYPLLLNNANIEVLGLWSVLVTTVSLLSVTDVGFSQLLVRNTGLDKTEVLNSTYNDYISAQIVYVIFFIFIITILFIFSGFILSALGDVYPLNALKLSIYVMIAGTFLQLASNLDAAILRSRHDNYFVHLFGSILPTITYISMIVGALVSKPIEGLALGTLLTGATSLVVFRNRVSSRLNIFNEEECSVYDGITNIPSLCQRGWVLFSVSLGFMLRGPAYRYLIVATAGLPQVAIFDMAMRITQMARDFIAVGFTVLYPSFSILIRQKQKKAIIEIIQVSLMVLISIGAFSLGLVIALNDQILSLWLGSYPAVLPNAIIVLSFWQILTLFNIPFWHLLMASENEKVAAYSVWAHTMSLLLILPVSSFYTMDTVGLLIYWSMTSIFAQVLIFYYTEVHLGLFWAPLNCHRLRLIIILAGMFLIGCCFTSQVVIETKLLLFAVVLSAAVYIVLVLLIGAKPVIQYIGREKSAQDAVG